MNVRAIKTVDTAIASLQEIMEHVSNLQSDEQEKFDNMSEKMQESEKGEKQQEIANDLESAVDSIQAAIDSLDNSKQE